MSFYVMMQKLQGHLIPRASGLSSAKSVGYPLPYRFSLKLIEWKLFIFSFAIYGLSFISVF